MRKSECLQQKIGTCAGCTIPGKVTDQRKKGLTLEKEPLLIAKISDEYCPQGTTMMVPKRKEQRVW
ncbi:hypothetical protein C4559_04740 [Candidatus Microgenomates bacterium]|nr:MAG: hypothetical protein C4559_04740 [Candidatus Microgenomates bacterium]